MRQPAAFWATAVSPQLGDKTLAPSMHFVAQYISKNINTALHGVCSFLAKKLGGWLLVCCVQQRLATRKKRIYHEQALYVEVNLIR